MAFVSDAQRKAVMVKLREKGFKQQPKKITAEGQFFRARIRNPNQFQKGSFRTVDVGKKGHTKIVIARPLRKRTTTTQAILIPKRDIWR